MSVVAFYPNYIELCDVILRYFECYVVIFKCLHVLSTCVIFMTLGITSTIARALLRVD
jgi:hypothetical protein